jgi:vancomycin permeability regulator SanA
VTPRVLSGGPGAGGVGEAEGMRRLAVKMGVPPGAIVVDHAGVSTRATVINTLPILRRLGSAIAVSHSYHLPRVRACYASMGLSVRCAPAEESYTLTSMPWLMTREISSLWAHWFRTLVGFAP